MRSEEIKWAGGEHEFCLPLDSLLALQDRCDGDGVGLIFHRLEMGMHKVKDVTATIALGLEGGGMKKREAVAKVESVFEDYGLEKMRETAYVVLGGALQGWPDDTPDEGEDGVETPNTSS